MFLTPGYLNTLHRGLSLVFNKELGTDSQGLTPLSQMLCIDQQSSGAEEEYDWLGDMPILQEIKGEQTKKNLQSRQVVITNKEFSCLLGLKRATLERDKAGLYKPRIMQLGQAARRWKERRLFETMVKNGFNNAYPDWTGKAYFAANKAMGKDKNAGTFTNAVTTAFSAAAFEAGVLSLQDRVDTNGEPMLLGDQGITLVVGPSLFGAAKRVLNAEIVAEGGVAVSNVNAQTAELRQWGYLRGAYANYWFLFAKDSGRAPFINQTEVPPATYMCTNPNDSYVIQNGEYLFQVYARGELGPGESLLSYGSTGAG
jgi:phage major head subunit gpT-like protein